MKQRAAIVSFLLLFYVLHAKPSEQKNTLDDRCNNLELKIKTLEQQLYNLSNNKISTESYAKRTFGIPQKNSYVPEKSWGDYWSHADEGDEINAQGLAEIQVKNKDLVLYFGGRLKDEFFMYNYAHTLRTDYHDKINFFRHKLQLDWLINQGQDVCGKPYSQAGIRLMNYVFWQKESNYMPMVIDEITIPSLDNITIAKDVRVRTLMPLIFVEQAWFKLNFDTFTECLNDRPTMLQVGYFPYIVGRGVTLGFHEDLAVDYLGWAGDGGFTRYPFMPPGILFRTELTENLTWDIYFNLWRETNASLSDVLKPERASRLSGEPERGSGKDRTTWVTKLTYKHYSEDFGQTHVEPYFLFVNAPEQGIEFKADASSKLFTAGCMVDWHNNNFSVNVEVAGQFGHQNVHALDRNVTELTRSTDSGNIAEVFSNINEVDAINPPEANPALQSAKAVSQDMGGTSGLTNPFEPNFDYTFLVNSPNNRSLDRQGKLIQLNSGSNSLTTADSNLANSTVFGNARFRNPYKLSYQGFMALADMTYAFDKVPCKLALSLGHISGDAYPYNEEVNKNYRGFIPLRSRYRGLGMQNFFMFDRQVTPRPLNISYRTLYAFNNLKDLSNLQFIGVGATWYPCEQANKAYISANIMWLWEHATLHKWDNQGKHPDPTIEAQLVRLRNTPTDNLGNPIGAPTLFSGWESTQKARKMLGTEVYFKGVYNFLDHCSWLTKVVLFFPGGLYKDLRGQPNQITQRVDAQNFLHFDSLGTSVVFGFVTGLNYRF